MNEELDKRLVESYPILFGDRHESPKVTAMCWGFECGDGWFEIINGLASKIEAINHKIEDPNNCIRATQVKEKFGGLRFYLSHYPNEYSSLISSAIAEAEALSEETCENCGKPGEVGGQSWLQCLCSDCRKGDN